MKKNIASNTFDTYSMGVSIESHLTGWCHHRAMTMDQNLSRTEFVIIWESATSLAEVAQKTGLSGPLAAARASMYRREGIHLKKFKPGRKDEASVDDLNKIIEEMGGMKASAVTVPTVTQAAQRPADEVEREQKERRLKIAAQIGRLLGNKHAPGVGPREQPE